MCGWGGVSLVVAARNVRFGRPKASIALWDKGFSFQVFSNANIHPLKSSKKLSLPKLPKQIYQHQTRFHLIDGWCQPFTPLWSNTNRNTNKKYIHKEIQIEIQTQLRQSTDIIWKMADAKRPLLNWWSRDEIQLSPETGKLFQELFQEHGDGDDDNWWFNVA